MTRLGAGDDPSGEKGVERLDQEPDEQDAARQSLPMPIRERVLLERVKHAGARESRRDEVRLWFVKALFAAVGGQFLVGAAILIWSKADWNNVKDLLAYGVAPFAAAMGVAGGYYFSPDPPPDLPPSN